MGTAVPISYFMLAPQCLRAAANYPRLTSMEFSALLRWARWDDGRAGYY
ncbi:MAG: hypothetical protein KAS46_02290 [Candidatus Aureabacteria bacterium]|nr:hypothetical protein [Candidatus Auribacterota bacterium]